MRVAICDDLHFDCELLKEHIRSYGEKNRLDFEFFFFESGETLLDSMVKITFDIVFLDIYMQGINGIETACAIRNAGFSSKLIFTTSSRDHAIESFEVQAVHYLVKPIDYVQVENALDRCKQLFALSDKYIEVISDRMTVRVPLRGLIYAEVFGNVTLLHTVTGIIKTYMSMDELISVLGNDMFLRCHRSYIVNMNYIDGLEASNFIMKNSDRIPIRRQDRQEMKQRYAEYLFNSVRGQDNGF